VPDPHQRMGKGLQEHLFYHGLFAASALYDPANADAAVVYVRSETQDGHQWELHAPGERLLSIDDGMRWSPTADRAYYVMARAFAATQKRDENFIEPREGGLGSALVHFSHGPADERCKQAILQTAARVTRALNMTAVDALPISDPSRFRTPGSSYHEAGGLDMGTDPRSSVTDAHGRFHQVPNLLCVDAAAFPRIGATNPHLTIVALARRQASALNVTLDA
jgi:choline dehydrogenase-like flavoprotein